MTDGKWTIEKSTDGKDTWAILCVDGVLDTPPGALIADVTERMREIIADERKDAMVEAVSKYNASWVAQGARDERRRLKEYFENKLVHYLGNAGLSPCGAMNGGSTTDETRVTCERCLQAIERKVS